MHQVQQSLNENLPEDFFTIDMISAYESLGKIIGEQVDDDLVDEIFARFCLGK
jgi:tRNA modification GTPase